MSALDDIRATLKAAKPVKRGWERGLEIGISARRSILAQCPAAAEPDGIEKLLGGIIVRETNRFDGWAIFDCSPAGRFHEVEVVE